jgi:hypothetical protein
VYDHETVVSTATQIIAWQAAAQQLPLPDLRAILATWQDDLAASLDALNGIYADHSTHHECTDMIKHAIAEVTRNSTAAAIFTLGLTQRAHQTAHQN